LSQSDEEEDAATAEADITEEVAALALMPAVMPNIAAMTRKNNFFMFVYF
jgi:hypothetical protein